MRARRGHTWEWEWGRTRSPKLRGPAKSETARRPSACSVFEKFFFKNCRVCQGWQPSANAGEAGEAHNLRRRRVRDRGVVEIQTHAVAVGTLATSRHALRRGGPQPSRAAWRCLALCIRGRASRLVNLGPHHRVDRSLPGGPSSPALTHTRGIGVGTPSCPCRPVFSCLTGCTESISTDVLSTVAAKSRTKPPVQANARHLPRLLTPCLRTQPSLQLLSVTSSKVTSHPFAALRLTISRSACLKIGPQSRQRTASTDRSHSGRPRFSPRLGRSGNARQTRSDSHALSCLLHVCAQGALT
ncbi:hypothetical protein L1887_50244 [Cichorium endivia]|nr:hypothetical protein L1887_50244 [Cichorium endivia]